MLTFQILPGNCLSLLFKASKANVLKSPFNGSCAFKLDGILSPFSGDFELALQDMLKNFSLKDGGEKFGYYYDNAFNENRIWISSIGFPHVEFIKNQTLTPNFEKLQKRWENFKQFDINYKDNYYLFSLTRWLSSLSESDVDNFAKDISLFIPLNKVVVIGGVSSFEEDKAFTSINPYFKKHFNYFEIQSDNCPLIELAAGHISPSEKVLLQMDNIISQLN